MRKEDRRKVAEAGFTILRTQDRIDGFDIIYLSPENPIHWRKYNSYKTKKERNEAMKRFLSCNKKYIQDEPHAI